MGSEMSKLSIEYGIHAPLVHWWQHTYGELAPTMSSPEWVNWLKVATDEQASALLAVSPEGVAALTEVAREQRVRDLVEHAHRLVVKAERVHGTETGHDIVARCVLFSGGNDSTVLAHVMRDRVTHAVHANTTIGIEQTRQYVRDACEGWGLPLIEEVAPVSYRELVIDQGFPGPGHHFKMYQRLKERCLRQARKKLVQNPRKQRVIFLAGRRRNESARRANVPEMEREGSVIWVSPLVHWTKLDMNTYRSMSARAGRPVPTNEVSELLHMSGECLCGAFAKRGELDEIEAWFPDVAAEIRDLEREVQEAGHPEKLCRWGWGTSQRDYADSIKNAKSGPLCSTCVTSALDSIGR